MGKSARMTWEQLGSPTEPGEYHVSGFGEILGLSQEDIDLAEKLGGNPMVDLESMKAASSRIEQWVIRTMQ